MMIYVEKARVIEQEKFKKNLAHIKSGNIVPGWLWIVLSVPRTWLNVRFPEVVDRQYSGMSWCSYYNDKELKQKRFRATYVKLK